MPSEAEDTVSYDTVLQDITLAKGLPNAHYTCLLYTSPSPRD